MLENAGFRCYVPGGAYYVMTDIVGLWRRRTMFPLPGNWWSAYGVAGVPGSSFYFDKACGSAQMRFCFCKNYETLALAERQKPAGPQSILRQAFVLSSEKWGDAHVACFPRRRNYRITRVRRKLRIRYEH